MILGPTLVVPATSYCVGFKPAKVSFTLDRMDSFQVSHTILKIILILTVDQRRLKSTSAPIAVAECVDITQ